MKQFKTITYLFFITLLSFSFAEEKVNKIEGYIDNNKANKAYQYYKNMLAEEPSFEATSEGVYLKARIFDALYRADKSVAGIQLEKQAISLYVQVLEKGTDTYVSKSDIHLSDFEKFMKQKSRALTNKGNSKASLGVATTLATSHETSTNYLFLAKVEDYYGLLVKAHDHYLRAILLDANQEEKTFVRVSFLMNKAGDRPSEKIEVINKALAKFPENKVLLLEKLQCFKVIGETNEVKREDLYLAIVNVDSQNQYVLYALGKLYYHQGIKADDKKLKWTQAQAYLKLASKAMRITSLQKEEVTRYLEKIQSEL